MNTHDNIQIFHQPAQVSLGGSGGRHCPFDSTKRLLRPARAATRRKSPNERLNLAVVGLGGQGLYDLHEASTENGVPTENVVAICDVDAAHLDRAVAKYPHLRQRQAIRRLSPACSIWTISTESCVATPDFAHAIVGRGRPQTQAARLQRKAAHEDDQRTENALGCDGRRPAFRRRRATRFTPARIIAGPSTLCGPACSDRSAAFTSGRRRPSKA